ncbi:MAG: hypothetical protein IJ399_00435 [Bacilli bacterium]|nr:hypothetical protein [Bacilli bacterium]
MKNKTIIFFLRNKKNFNIYIMIIFVFLFMSLLNYVNSYYGYRINPNNTLEARMKIYTSDDDIAYLSKKLNFKKNSCNLISNNNNICYITYERKNSDVIISYLNDNNYNYELLEEQIPINKIKIQKMLSYFVIVSNIILVYIYITVLNIIKNKSYDYLKLLYYLGYSLKEIKNIKIISINIILIISLIINFLIVLVLLLFGQFISNIFYIIIQFIILSFINIICNISSKNIMLKISKD